MRTNIVINPDLMQSAMQLGGLDTKKATIEAALLLYVQLHQQAKLRSFRGKLKWEGDLHKMRVDS